MSKPDQVIAQIIRALYEAEAAKWSVQDKAVLLTAINSALLPVESNLPEKPKAEEAGKEAAS